MSESSTIYGKLKELEGVVKLRKEIQDKENALTTPTLSDLDLMPQIWEMLKDEVKEAELRRVFIVVILFLFAPKSLVGYKLPFGIREAMAKSMRLRLKNHSFISNNIRTSLFYYEQYRDFRSQVDAAIEKVKELLGLR